MSDESCEGFEIAIEMRRHGADDAEASRRLDDHLRSCPRCRAYEALGTETEAGLRSDAENARANVDLDRLRARGRRILGGILTDAGAFSLLLSLAFLTRLIRGGPGIDPVVTGLQAILFLALPFVELRRSRRALAEAWSSDVLFHELRRNVVARLRASVVIGVLSVVLSTLFFVDRAVGSGVFPGGAFRAVFVAGFGALGLFVLAVRVPRLLRERREIPAVTEPYEFPPSTSTFGLP